MGMQGADMSGSGRYCEGSHCSEELPVPSLWEAMDGRMRCPRCSKWYDVWVTQRQEVCDRAERRIALAAEMVAMVADAVSSELPHGDPSRPRREDFNKLLARFNE